MDRFSLAICRTWVPGSSTLPFAKAVMPQTRRSSTTNVAARCESNPQLSVHLGS